MVDHTELFVSTPTSLAKLWNARTTVCSMIHNSHCVSTCPVHLLYVEWFHLGDWCLEKGTLLHYVVQVYAWKLFPGRERFAGKVDSSQGMRVPTSAAMSGIAQLIDLTWISSWWPMDGTRIFNSSLPNCSNLEEVAAPKQSNRKKSSWNYLPHTGLNTAH